jgi:hypothetical protein
MTPARILILIAFALMGCDEAWHLEDESALDPSVGGGSPAGEQPSALWSCDQVSQCAGACGTNMDCVNTCKARGCSGAQVAFDAITSCVMAKCLSSCMSGFGPECDRCTRVACKAETAACDAQSCPPTSSSTPPDQNQPGAAPPSPEPPPAGSTGCVSCAGIQSCASGCGTDMGCINTKCKPQDCGEAQAAFDAVTSCIMAKCLSACMGGYTPDCAKCADSSCKAAMEACQANTCPATATCGSGMPSPQAPQASCKELVQCKQAAGIFDGNCTQRGCPSAQQLFTALGSCAKSACSFECLLGWGAASCMSCLGWKCRDQWQSCDSNQC